MKFTWYDQNRRRHEHDLNDDDFFYDVRQGEHNGLDIGVLSALDEEGDAQLQTYLRDLRCDGVLLADRLVLPPGGMFCVAKGHLTGWREVPIPSWAPQRLAGSPATALAGPVPVSWPSDRFGNEVSGAGIAPYWADWQWCVEGVGRMVNEALGWANRMPIAYYDPDPGLKFALQFGHDRPVGYEIDQPNALRWDPDAMDYLVYQLGLCDGQHLHRAYRCALALRKLHPFFQWYCDALLVHIKLSYERRDIGGRPSNTRLWTCEQWLDPATTQEEMRTACGRELAHVARLVWEMEPDSQLATDLEDMLLRAGIPWFLDARSIYAPESREHGGGVFGDTEPIAHVFEWLLMMDAARHRPRLKQAVRDMLDYVAPMNHWGYLKGTMNGDGVGSSVTYEPPWDYAMFFGRPEDAGYQSAEHLLQVASSRSVDDNSLNACPRKAWEDAL